MRDNHWFHCDSAIGGNYLPFLEEGDAVKKEKILPDQHFTQPPPRFSEASLVKKLEELGIGRPSTYASILQVLQVRQYVKLEKKQFIPETRGRLVSLFLAHYSARYVEYDFTARLMFAEGKFKLKPIFGGIFRKSLPTDWTLAPWIPTEIRISPLDAVGIRPGEKES